MARGAAADVGRCIWGGRNVRSMTSWSTLATGAIVADVVVGCEDLEVAVI